MKDKKQVETATDGELIELFIVLWLVLLLDILKTFFSWIKIN